MKVVVAAGLCLSVACTTGATVLARLDSGTTHADVDAFTGDTGAGGGCVPESFTVRFPTVTVAAGAESTQCVVLALGNDHPIHVGSIENVLGEGALDMLVYRTNETTPHPDPVDCVPFTSTLPPTSAAPLMITQRRDDVLTLPPGVAFELGANQLIQLEVHSLNTTSASLQVEPSSTFRTTCDFREEAAFLFVGSSDIALPAHASATVGPVYLALPTQLGAPSFFAINGHEHQYGTGVRVWSAASATDPGTSMYEVPSSLWSEPQTVQQDPPVVLPAGGGFRFECDYVNSSDHYVGFGASAQGEVCFFVAYYYPSQGSLFCFHITSTSAPRDICCPGDPLCPILLGMR